MKTSLSSLEPRLSMAESNMWRIPLFIVLLVTVGTGREEKSSITSSTYCTGCDVRFETSTTYVPTPITVYYNGVSKNGTLFNSSPAT